MLEFIRTFCQCNAVPFMEQYCVCAKNVPHSAKNVTSIKIESASYHNAKYAITPEWKKLEGAIFAHRAAFRQEEP